MRRYLFKKANYLLAHTELLVETDHSIRLKVNREEVVFKYKKHKLIALCTCKAGALNFPCSHIIAGITYLTNGRNNPQKTPKD